MAKTDENPEDRYLRLAAQGDKRSFGVLYERYLDEIYRFVYLKVGNKPTAEDITEETFIRTWKRLPGIYQSDGKIDNLRAWLYRIANNLVIDFYRKRQPSENIARSEPGNSSLPEMIAVEHEQMTLLVSALRELKSGFQQVIILRLVNDLSHKEIAKIMKISEAHSRVLFYRALKKLKSIMVNKESDYA